MPESTCIDACEKRAEGCSEWECRRGCRLSLDRLVEREGDNVIACAATGLVATCGEPVQRFALRARTVHLCTRCQPYATVALLDDRLAAPRRRARDVVRS